MKQDRLEHIVKESLESLEPEVPSHLWENISSKIPAPQAGQPGTEAAGGNSGAAGAGSSALVKMGTAALVIVGGGLIVWQLNSADPDTVAEKTLTEESVQASAEKDATSAIPVPVQREATDERNEEPTAQRDVKTDVTSLKETTSAPVESSVQTNTETTAVAPVKDEGPKAESVASDEGAAEQNEPPTDTESSVQSVTPLQTEQPKENTVVEQSEMATDSGSEVIETAPEESFAIVEAGILASAVKGKRPLQVDFQNVTEAMSYEWNFGNDQYSSKADPVVTFEEPGDYTVRLTVTDAQGHRMTDEMDITVYSLFLPNIFTPNNDGTNDTYEVIGSNVTNVAFSIYRIDGSLVFEGRGLNAKWDGTDSREPRAENYLVIATATLQDGSEVVERKNLIVQRD